MELTQALSAISLIAHPFPSVSCFLLMPLMMTSGGQNTSEITEKYEYISNAVVGGTVEFPFCRFGRYKLPPHLDGSDRLKERYNRHSYTIIISNLQKNDSAFYPCIQLPSSPQTKVSNWMLQVYDPEDLIEISCEKDIYTFSRNEIIPVRCNFKSIHAITNRTLSTEDCRKNQMQFDVSEGSKTIDISIDTSDDEDFNADCVVELRLWSQPGITNVTRFHLTKRFLSAVNISNVVLPRKTQMTLENVCSVTGNPRPDLAIFYYEQDLLLEQDAACTTRPENAINGTIKLNERPIGYGRVEVSATFNAFEPFSSGCLSCVANNSQRIHTRETWACIYDPEITYQIFAEKRLILPGESTKIVCQVPICHFDTDGKMRFEGETGGGGAPNFNYTRQRARYYYNITHEIKAMSAENEGTYTCVVSELNDSCSAPPSVKLRMFRQQKPIVNMTYETNELGIPGTVYCKFLAYPPYNLTVIFLKCEKIGKRDCREAWVPEYSLNKTIDFESNELVTISAVATSGRYFCRVKNTYGIMQKEKYVCIGDPNKEVQQLAIRAPKEVKENEEVNITCIASICKFQTVRLMFTPVNSLMIPVNEKMIEESDHFYKTVSTTIANISNYNSGDFSCEGIGITSRVPEKVSQRIMIKSIFFALTLTDSNDITAIVIGATLAIIAFIVLGALGNILYQKRQHKNRNIRLAEELKKGDVKSFNPDLSLQEQAELLPLHSKWEFPRNNLKLGKQLGAGFFGVVLQGEASGIVPNEIRTTVAVKMAKKHSEGDVMRALICELKIMSHMGRHPNVVRLLGAVIDGLGDNELMVIVEFCIFGNLNCYLLKNRRRFIDNWMDKHLAYANLHGDAIQESSNAGGYLELTETEDQETAYETPKGELVLDDERVEFIVNKSEAQEMPLNTKILVGWSYQIARGMEWLASKRLMHGDLAARNILLTTNNIVKICDFGLAKNMYAQQCYQRKEDAKLPVKWLALESVKDHVFTLKSDVWAYGILMWEVFSLGMTPYPEFNNFGEILENLQKGYRMGRPAIAPECIFQLMFQCWKQDPEERPLFSELSNSLYQYLDDPHRSFLADQEACGVEEEDTEHDYLELFQPSGRTVNEYAEGYVTLPCPGGYQSVPIGNTELTADVAKG